MFTAQQSPIAIDFGSASVKLMQLDRADSPKLLAAAELMIPESIRANPQHALAHVEAELPALLKSAGFKGKKAVTAIPSGLACIQHMQVVQSPGVSIDEIVKGQLQMQLNCAPNSLVVRCLRVQDAKCRDNSRTEVICFAASRDVVMRYVQLLNQCKLDVSGIHTESLSTIWSFAGLMKAEGDEAGPTMYLNMGWRGTGVTISHGPKIVFSRYIHVGGQHFDHQIARTLKCELHEASAQRHSLDQPLSRVAAYGADAAVEAQVPAAAGVPGGVPGQPAAASAAAARRGGPVPADLIPVPMCASAQATIERYRFSELVDTMVDEVSMCLRYHRGMFPNMPIKRAILLGGDSRQAWLTRTIADHLTMNTYVGDPLRRYESTKRFTPGLNLGEPRPGWAVACGLCHAPNDQ